MTRDLIIERFRDGGPGHRPPRGPAAERGDHFLNPGYVPKGPLKLAAVLVGLVDRPHGLHLLLTQRTDHLSHHPGQVSFPGGHIEDDDDGPEGAALRETEEEIGLDRSHITLLGRLTDYVTRTGFRVTPVIALVRPGFTLKPDPFEVAEVFEVPLSFLLDPANHQRHSREFEGKERHFYAMPYNGHFIWGATAGMIRQLYEYLHDPDPTKAPVGKDA
ncbi:MAG: CoA pyrophosphatase [Rhodobacterales bacterium]|nr:CoA pyrophosphatase [Rhodobacterales bacterium]